MKIKMDRRWRREVLTSPEVKRDLRRRADRVDAQAGPGHRVDEQVGRIRARASVVTDSPLAMFNEATDRNLTRALDAGR